MDPAIDPLLKTKTVASPHEKSTSTSAILTPSYFAFWKSGHPILSHSILCTMTILFISATCTMPIMKSIIQPLFTFIAITLLRITFLVTAIVSFLHQTGALRRYVLQFAENELSKLMNGTLVTISDAHVDLYRGQVVVNDFIIHNKDRGIWKWDSPCLARVGRIEATLNIASVIQLPFIGRICGHTFFDIYTILVEDIQVFIEKRKNIFNFHLLDGSLNIPDHNLIMSEYKSMKQRKRDAMSIIPEVMSSKSTATYDGEEERGDLNVRDGDSSSTREDEANKIVEKLIGGISKIGQAADQGPEGLKSALRNQKDGLVGLVKNFKQLHAEKEIVNTSNASKNLLSKKECGVSLMREVTKVVEKNVDQIKNQVGFLQKPPDKKDGWKAGIPDDIRVGSILLREARIFLKDIIIIKGDDDGEHHYHVSTEDEREDESSSGWSKPLVIFEMAITGAELSPPMSARDKYTGLPVVGINMDRFVDIIVKRILAELAKSNTGRIFRTAFGDVFSFMHENRQWKKG